MSLADGDGSVSVAVVELDRGQVLGEQNRGAAHQFEANFCEVDFTFQVRAG